MDYRVQRLKEDLTNAQRRNKHQKKQLANYKNAYDRKCNETNKYKQALNEIKDKLLCYGETFDSKTHLQFQKDCLEIIDKYLGDNNGEMEM